MARPFVVVDIPAQETLIGRLTVQVPGCTVDLLGRPLVDPEHGHRYRLHYIVSGITPQAREVIAPELEDVYSRFRTLSWGGGRWEVLAEVPVEQIRSPGLRFVAGLFGLAPMPWVVFRAGIGEARLLPSEGTPPETVASTLRSRLRSSGIEAAIRTQDFHEAYAARQALAHW